MWKFWLRIRMVLTVMIILLIALFMARLFSGPEDTWIRNESGEWVAHGYPSGPPPPDDYHEPIFHFIIPVSFLIAFTLSLFQLRTCKPHNRLTPEIITRDIKFYNYLGTVLILFGMLIILGVILETFMVDNGEIRTPEFLFVCLLAGCGGISIITGVLLLILKQIRNDHFQLEKSYREIIEKCEIKK